MGKFDKKKSAASGRKGNGILIGGLVAVLALVALLLVFLSGNTPEVQETVPTAGQSQPAVSGDATTEPVQTQPVQTQPAGLTLTLESVEQEDQTMVVTTSYCIVKYPFAFSDMIRVKAEVQNGQERLMFCAYLGDTEYPMFDIVFDGSEGFLVGTLALADGRTVSVTARLYEADTSLEPDMLQSFYAAQETINDIIGSLATAEGFTAAQ